MYLRQIKTPQTEYSLKTQIIPGFRYDGINVLPNLKQQNWEKRYTQSGFDIHLPTIVYIYFIDTIYIYETQINTRESSYLFQKRRGNPWFSTGFFTQ